MNGELTWDHLMANLEYALRFELCPEDFPHIAEYANKFWGWLNPYSVDYDSAASLPLSDLPDCEIGTFGSSVYRLYCKDSRCSILKFENAAWIVPAEALKQMPN